MSPVSLPLALRCGAVGPAAAAWRATQARPAPLQPRRASLVLGARHVRVAPARRAAVCVASSEEDAPSAVEAAPAAADASGYESSGDENVLSGKVKSVSRMTLAELKAELSELGLETGGAKAELVARLRVARAGATVSPAVAEATPAKRPAPSTNGAAAPAPASSAAPGDLSVDALAKMVARLEEELVLTRAMATSAVHRAEKAEAALASASGSPSPAPPSAASELATLRVVCKLHFGEVLLAVGSHPAVGSWDVAGAAPLTWSDGDVWQAVVALPAEARVEMKFVVRRPDGGLVWQQGANLEAVLAPGALSRALCFEGSYPSAFGGAGPFTVRVAGECTVGGDGEPAAEAAPVA